MLIPVLYPVPLEAAGSPTDACFTMMDCHPDMKKSENEGQCGSPQGCCIQDRCFVISASCKTQGKEPMGGCFAKGLPVTLAINFGPVNQVVDLANYISVVYKYAIGIGGVMAAVMMMIGGFMYLTAADSDRLSRGKQFIVDALTGLVVIFGAYLLLQTVNPDLVTMSLPKIPVVKRQTFVGCQYTNKCAACGMTYYVTKDFVDDLNKKLTGDGAIDKATNKPCAAKYVNATGEKSATSCIGKGCHCLNEFCTDNVTSCQAVAGNKNTSKCGWESSKTLAAGRAPSGSREAGAAAPAGGAAAPAGGAAAPAGGAAAPAGGAAATPPAEPTWGCFFCLADGERCSPNGQNDKCCGGYCGKGQCTHGAAGDVCDKENKECASGFCQTDWGNSCSNGGAGSPCDDNNECSSGKCIGMYDLILKNACGSGKPYSRCRTDSECSSDETCTDSVASVAGVVSYLLTFGYSQLGNSGGVCVPKNVELITSCGSNNECKAKGTGLEYCAKFKTKANFCTDGGDGSMCTANDQCAKGHCITSGSPAIAVCSSGDPGNICDDDTDCEPRGKGHCYTGGDFDVCVTGMVGSRCDDGKDCEAGYECSPNPRAEGGVKQCTVPQGTRADYCVKPPG